MIAVAAGLGVFLMFLTTRLTTPHMALLYGDLAVEDSSAIVTQLESRTVPYELRGAGTQIFVPADDVARLRIAMASERLPNFGSVGYELFDRAEGFGSTTFVQQLNQLRALEGELSRTIAALAQVKSARVHLALPRRELFSRDTQEPSASIVLRLRGPGLENRQVVSIQHLVATAVPGLNPSRISIVDANGNLLARGADGGDDTQALAANADEMRRTYENRLARTIEALLERSVGLGKVRAEVAAEMDFDRLTTSDEIFDPDSQVVRSTQTAEETDNTSEASSQGAVSVTSNLPQGGPDTGALNSASSRIEETVNYEISRTVRTLVRETGAVRRLSVAVLVDGATDANGAYQPRTEEEMQQLVALVKSAIGYEETRGDVVEVVNLRFAAPEESLAELPAAASSILGVTTSSILELAPTLVLGVVAILVILLVVKPIVERTLEVIPKPSEGAAGSSRLLTDHSGAGATASHIPGPEDPADEVEESSEYIAPGEDPQLKRAISASSVEGRVRASSLKRITEIVENHPDETVSIMRNWMYQDS
ncbi:MAG: flagellar basal-body MS-ring/collar protein FliF [Alphaproteobacteria bacterium]